MKKGHNAFDQAKISEIETRSEKVTLIRYNTKTTDCGELANALLDSKLPKGKQMLILPDDVEISQMSPEEVEGLLLELQDVLKEICKRTERR